MIALVSFMAMAMFGNKYEETPDVIRKSVKKQSKYSIKQPEIG